MGQPTESGRRRSRASQPETAEPGTMIPARRGRAARAESVFARLVMTMGILAIGTALGAILVGQDVAGWITGVVVSAVSVVLAAILWSARTV